MGRVFQKGYDQDRDGDPSDPSSMVTVDRGDKGIRGCDGGEGYPCTVAVCHVVVMP